MPEAFSDDRVIVRRASAWRDAPQPLPPDSTLVWQSEDSPTCISIGDRLNDEQLRAILAKGSRYGLTFEEVRDIRDGRVSELLLRRGSREELVAAEKGGEA